VLRGIKHTVITNVPSVDKVFEFQKVKAESALLVQSATMNLSEILNMDAIPPLENKGFKDKVYKVEYLN